MLTTEQFEAVSNALYEHRVKLRYIGIQNGVPRMPPMPLFNVVEGDYAIGSTVTLKSMLAKGFVVEVVE